MEGGWRWNGWAEKCLTGPMTGWYWGTSRAIEVPSIVALLGDIMWVRTIVLGTTLLSALDAARTTKPSVGESGEFLPGAIAWNASVGAGFC